MRISDWSSDVCSPELGPPIEGTPWMGSRPSIIDGLPVIGRALLHENLWFNFGHHHIGLSLSAGSALLLTALLQDSQPPVDPEIGRASCREECVSTCRSRWSPYH